MAPHVTQQRCTTNNMKPEMDSKPQISESTQHLNSENEPKTKDLQTKPSLENRVPPLVMFEEEGTQTDNYNGIFLYGISDNVEEQGGTTNVNRLSGSTMEDPSRISSASQSRQAGGLSTSSGGIQHGTCDDSRVRCDLIDDSSSVSDSGESVIERLSKSVSRLLKPVLIIALILSIIISN